jgi:FtsP/CotA-like multicopper oxidase with cupredoxin domain
MTNQRRLSRRMFLGGGIGLTGLTSGLLVSSKVTHASPTIANVSAIPDKTSPFANLPFMAELDTPTIGFDPSLIMTTFEKGKVSKLAKGQILREFTLTATNQDLLPAIGLRFTDGLVFDSQVPGITLRATQGEHIRVTFKNKSDTAISLQFTGISLGPVDSINRPVAPGASKVYEFDAETFGLYIYQGLAFPLVPHVFKGLYGTLIIDPPTPRPKAHELSMTLNAFVFSPVGKNPPAANDLYAINTVAYHFVRNPIPIPVNRLVRIYLVNVTEFASLNSLHVHGTTLNIYRSGTSLQPNEIDTTVMLAPAQRAILEFTFPLAGQYMFHSYQGEFADLGCMGIFNVK